MMSLLSDPTAMSPLTIVLIILVLLIVWAIAAYNGLIRVRTNSEEAWSDIDVQLKRRHDLIPNLVSTVKGYAAHEAGTLEKVVQARNAAVSASASGSTEQRAQAENVLTGALRQIFALAEAYPDLKANQNFMQLQAELRDTEDKIMSARRFYNGNVRELNMKIDSFPTNIIASMFHFAKRQFFEIDDAAEKENVKVEF